MFDSLEWTKTDGNPTVKEEKVSDFLQQTETDNRWTYEGSLTTPPCTTSVYWNIVQRVYPISQKHLDQFLNQLGRQKDYDLKKSGNYRMI